MCSAVTSLGSGSKERKPLWFKGFVDLALPCHLNRGWILNHSQIIFKRNTNTDTKKDLSCWQWLTSGSFMRKKGAKQRKMLHCCEHKEMACTVYQPGPYGHSWCAPAEESNATINAWKRERGISLLPSAHFSRPPKDTETHAYTLMVFVGSVCRPPPRWWGRRKRHQTVASHCAFTPSPLNRFDPPSLSPTHFSPQSLWHISKLQGSKPKVPASPPLPHSSPLIAWTLTSKISFVENKEPSCRSF